MPTSTSVKYFHSAMSGAPVLSGVAGTLIAIIDACLVDGFGLKAVDSIVVTSGLAVANMSTGVGAFEADTVVLITGSSVTELNGEKRVISVTANSITFDATGVSDQTVTTGITAKLASAGWGKAFTSTNLAAYRSNDVTGTRMYLRVDDSSTTNARVVGYESMTDINTGVRAFQQATGGGFWPKANAANATARGWTIIADSKTFWIWLHTVTTSIGVSGYMGGFGDFVSMKSGDTYSAAITATSSDLSTSTTAGIENLSHGYATSITANGTVVARSYTGMGGAVNVARRAESYVYSDGYSGTGAWIVNFPNSIDLSVLLSRVLIHEGAGLRGVLRGPLFVAQNAHSFFGWRDKLNGQGATEGRRLLALKGAAPAGTASGSVMFFDITGPWG